jgi:hypothetical protein
VKRFISAATADAYTCACKHGDGRRCIAPREIVMKKFMIALFVAAGIGSLGMSLAASFSPADAACHNQRTSRFYNGTC